MFRFKRGIPLDYDRQGYIFFESRRYKRMTQKERDVILALCKKHGREHWKALLAYVTTDSTATEICMKYYISRATLYRVVRAYYEGFPDRL